MTTQASLAELRARTGRLVAADLVALGATYRQIDHWTRTGRIHAHQAGRGSGHIRTYDVAEGIAVVRVIHLLKTGLHVEFAWWCARLGAGEHRLGPGVVLTITDPDGTR